MGMKAPPHGASIADCLGILSKNKATLFVVMATVLIAFSALIVYIVNFNCHNTIDLVSTGNLPCGPFIKKSEDTVFVTPVGLINTNKVPIKIQQISVQDIDSNTVLFPMIYVVDLDDDFLLESAGYFSQSEFLRMYSDRINPLKCALDGYLSPEDQTFRSKYICIFLLFDNFPPSQNRVEVTCKYGLCNTTTISDILLRRE